MNSDRVFFQNLYNRFRDEGNLGDVFGEMVAWNVPRFILGELWPEKLQSMDSSLRLAFTAAEAGWKGRIDNIKSRLLEEEGALIYDFDKSYVMECDVMVSLGRLGDEFSLVWLPKSSSQTWTEREETEIRLPKSNGTYLHHYFVKGKERVEKENTMPLSRRAYARVGLQIPRREITGLAILSGALMEKYSVLGKGEKSALVNLLSIREKDSLTREDAGTASEFLDSFYAIAQKEKIDLHPFWFKFQEMKKFMV